MIIININYTELDTFNKPMPYIYEFQMIAGSVKGYLNCRPYICQHPPFRTITCFI